MRFTTYLRDGSPRLAVVDGDTAIDIAADLRTVLALPEVRTRMRETTFIPGDTTPQSFGAFIRQEVDQWGGLVQRRNIRPG